MCRTLKIQLKPLKYKLRLPACRHIAEIPISISEPVSVYNLRHEEVVASLGEVVRVPEEELGGVPAGVRRVAVARQRHLEHPRAAAPSVRHVEPWNTPW